VKRVTPSKLEPMPSLSRKPPTRTKLLSDDLSLGEVTAESRKQAACVLEVLAGLRSPEQAAEALGVSLPTYYNLETRALRGLIHGCTATPPGRTMMLLKQVRALESKCGMLEKQVGRYQALLRNAQRSAGLLPPPVEPRAKPGGKRKRKRPVVRALRAISVLQASSDSPGNTREQPVDSPIALPPESVGGVNVIGV
jgi:hypothetical protein